MPKTNLQQHIIIDALPGKVWKVLTCATYLGQYLFEGTIHCQWTEGSPLTLVNSIEGKTETIHKGNVLQVVPEVLLKYDLHEDVSCIHTTYELIPSGDGVQLKIHCQGFKDSDEEHLIRLQQIRLLLQKIKWLAEYA
jgi:hypothetical protein